MHVYVYVYVDIEIYMYVWETVWWGGHPRCTQSRISVALQMSIGLMSRCHCMQGSAHQALLMPFLLLRYFSLLYYCSLPPITGPPPSSPRGKCILAGAAIEHEGRIIPRMSASWVRFLSGCERNPLTNEYVQIKH